MAEINWLFFFLLRSDSAAAGTSGTPPRSENPTSAGFVMDNGGRAALPRSHRQIATRRRWSTRPLPPHYVEPLLGPAADLALFFLLLVFSSPSLTKFHLLPKSFHSCRLFQCAEIQQLPLEEQQLEPSDCFCFKKMQFIMGSNVCCGFTMLCLIPGDILESFI